MGYFLTIKEGTLRSKVSVKPFFVSLLWSNVEFTLYFIPGEMDLVSVKSNFLPYPILAPDFLVVPSWL